MARALPPLGPLEVAVLEHLWKAGDSDVVATHAAVARGRELSANTVGSALERLHRKGLARRWKVSHAYRYAAAQEREAFYARRMLEAAGSSPRALARDGLLAAFVDLLAKDDAGSLDQLEALIRRKRGERA